MTKPKTAHEKAQDYAHTLTKDRSVFDGNDERNAIVAFTAGYLEGQRDAYASAEGLVEAEWAEINKWKPWLHWCMTAWDGLLIDRYDPEFEVCTCFGDKKPFFKRAKGES